LRRERVLQVPEGREEQYEERKSSD